jgi:lycopene beta-cyclase
VTLDLLFVGGGLANGLLAYRLAETRPDLTLLVLESGACAGGNHTWSFHEGDLTPGQHAWIAPFVSHGWPGYDVAFPGLRRGLGLPYLSVSSSRFAQVLRDRLGARLRCESAATLIEPLRAALGNGDTIEARAVVDGRGPITSAALELGFQKFLGLEIRTRAPHRLARPILMDATVPQQDGYRFVYVLPLAEDRLLVEDTYYADGAALDPDALRNRVLAYATGRGWEPAEILRSETGVLPVVLGGDIAAFWRDGSSGVPRSGLRAGLFHPTTGYSLPEAVRLADRVATLPDLSAPALHAAIRAWSVRRWQEQSFFRLLNRMLFRAGPPAERFRVLQRFYGLPEPAIGRFYAGRLTMADKLRLLVGRPPVPVLGAARALMPFTGTHA